MIELDLHRVHLWRFPLKRIRDTWFESDKRI